MNHLTSWEPTDAVIKASNIYKSMQEQGIDNYSDFWKWSVEHKSDFWNTTIQHLGILFKRRFSQIMDLSEGVTVPNWLPNAKMNIVDSCFQNENNATAIVFQHPGGELQKVSQHTLEILVNRIANGLIESGLQQGDKIAIDLPMTVEAVAIYLAAIKAGMPVVTIADSFTPKEIEVRLKITSPKLLFTQDVLKRAGKELPLYSKVLKANAPKAVVIKVSEQSIEYRKEDIFWDNFLSNNDSFESVAQNPEDVITVLFSSGTTGEPKAIPWTHTTPIKGASDGYYHQDIQNSDVVCWPTNLGWMMGPWLVFAALINKATVALYYGAPTDQDFGKFVQNAGVTMLGVIPSFVNYWKNSACMEAYDWSKIKCFSSTGEVSNPVEMSYLMNLAGNKPVIEYCGGTEIGGGYITGTVVQNNYPSTFSSQALGGEFVLLDENNQMTSKGEVFILPPVMGLSNTLLNRDHFEVYYKGTPTYNNQVLRRHGDQLVQMENGYYKAQGRVDDAMNLGGIKISSVQIEAVLNKLNFVVESAAIAVPPKEGGPGQLVVFYVDSNDKINKEEKYMLAKQCIREELNPLFKLTDFINIEKLPRTASNKVMRRSLRDLYAEKYQ